MEAACVVDCRNVLGEGALWCPLEQRLWWIDISTPTLWSWQRRGGRLEHWPLPKPPGSFALRSKGGFLIAFRNGLATLDAPGGEPQWLSGLELGDERFNDGKTDRAGRFWAGTLDRRLAQAIGQLYRIDGEMKVTAMDRGFTISNRRVFAEAAPGHGGPDGMTVDAEGFVWSAQFDRWCVNRYAPDGRLERSVRLPVQRPTTCMFGGPDLATLYVTSARMDLSEEALAAQPQAGGVFAIDPGVRGLPEPRFAG